MKRLADFKGEEKRQVGAKIIPYLCALLASKTIQDAQKKSQSLDSLAAALLKECKVPLMGLLAAMNRTPAEQYKPNAAVLLNDLRALLQDPDILALLSLNGKYKVHALYHAEDGSTQKIIFYAPLK